MGSHFSASAENGGTFDGWLGYDCNSCIFNECRNFLCYGCLLLLFRFLSICSRRGQSASTTILILFVSGKRHLFLSFLGLFVIVTQFLHHHRHSNNGSASERKEGI